MTSNLLPPERPLSRGFDITAPAGAIARRVGQIAYGVYACVALVAVIVPVAIALLATPGVVRRRRVAHWGAKGLLTAIGSRPRVDGSLPTTPCVVVANHSSYLDGIILTAVLPPQFSFLIKHEMADMPIAGFVLRRIGSHFVDRNDAAHRRNSARKLVAAAVQGSAVAVFPEGMFERSPGLKKFQLGAFLAAWRARSAVVPAIIGGARRKLPAGAFFVAPGPLTVRFCAALTARDHADAGDLMRSTRAAILEHLAEPDLDDP